MHLLEPEMQPDKQKNEIKRHEAWQVYGALLVSCDVLIMHKLVCFH